MEPLLVADSFRVRMNHGRAESRGIERHLERFTRATVQAMPMYEAPPHFSSLDEFIRNSIREIAAYGEGFPRLELRSDGELGLRLRPLPDLRESIELRSAPLLSSTSQPPGSVDHPERKGPNIERYAALNRELGAEALLLSAEGQVLEGSTSSILWWRGDELHSVIEPQRVGSVTEAMLAVIAREHGAAPRPATISPAELPRFEAWAVNALHGIRLVTSVDGVPSPRANTQRLGYYRRALDQTWQPISE